ncbi:hypothetical protein P872_17760 [Rhodonellum psychrophilum GCM71 = DSM 17998]|uniref:Uncharacterized protein n=1 Tax=Rhodonellum psychrophilum GCM71 = DSM 17998 TaxID=1123057 RepID=U5C2R8_9BACT|nr:hypothetical protein P872_17760 [Rhodonellum psychrophilum GCM71 = DSM 17998]
MHGKNEEQSGNFGSEFIQVNSARVSIPNSIAA